MNTSNLKDKITSIGALVVVIAGAVNAYLQSQTGDGINWTQLIMAVVVAVIGYFTGKAPSGAPKTPTQVAEQNPVEPPK
jgi:hypothetical protein